MSLPQSITVHWSGEAPPLTFGSPLHLIPLGAVDAPLDVRNFLAPPQPPTSNLDLTLAASFPATITSPPTGAKFPPPALWRVYDQPPDFDSTDPKPEPSLCTFLHRDIPFHRALAEAPGRGEFPLALGVHVVTRPVDGYEDYLAAGVIREAWIRAHRLNRLASPPFVPHWYGLYAGLGRTGGAEVPVYASLVSASGTSRSGMTPDQRDTVLSAYKQIHAIGIVHRAARPQNWHVSPSGDVSIVEFGRAHVRRRGFGVFTRELEAAEWVVDEIEFDRAAAAETQRVKTILGLV